MSPVDEVRNSTNHELEFYHLTSPIKQIMASPPKSAFQQYYKKLSFWQRIKASPRYIRYRYWEFWPIWLLNIPVFFIWIYFSIRARSFFFFSAANPTIETGGLFGESKFNIMKKVPDHLKPKTIFVPGGSTVEFVLNDLKNASIDFPVIAKPDVGERGFMVKKLTGPDDLAQYLDKCKVGFLIQEFIDYPNEMSLTHYRMPGSSHGCITSVSIKDKLKVTGDGKSKVWELIFDYPRTCLQLPQLLDDYADILEDVPGEGETVNLSESGNHSKGATFLDSSHLICEELTQTFDEISTSLQDVYFAKYDLKYRSYEQLLKGKGIRIFEVNGVGAEPAHVYDPAFPISKAYPEFYRQWKIIYRISKANHKNGVAYMNWREARQRFTDYTSYIQKAEKDFLSS